eukprot:jgi/Hompol1/7102/HPOL_002943-RA
MIQPSVVLESTETVVIGATFTKPHLRTASYEPYDEIMLRVRNHVKEQLSGAASRANTTKDKLKGTQSYAITTESSSDDELGWEYDLLTCFANRQTTIKKDDSDASNEELLAFRTDLSPLLGPTIDTLSSVTAIPEQLSVLQKEAAPSPSAFTLDSDFNSALESSTMLVDFQHQFIQQRLATIREHGHDTVPASHDVTIVLMDAIRAQTARAAAYESAIVASTIDATGTESSMPLPYTRPMINIDKQSGIAAHASRQRQQQQQQQQQQQPGFKLAAKSEPFARFIPTVTPIFAAQFADSDADSNSQDDEDPLDE